MRTPEGLCNASFPGGLPPLTDRCEPVLWLSLLEWLGRAGQLNGVDARFRKAFKPFMEVIPDTRPFIFSRPVSVLPDEIEEAEIEHAEPPFPAIWIESDEEKSREIFRYARPHGFLDHDEPAPHVGLWSIQLSAFENLSLHVVKMKNHINVLILDTRYSPDIKALWAAMEPFLASGWWNAIYDSGVRNRNFHPKIKKFVPQVNTVTVIRSDHEPRVHRVPSEFKREYAVRWPVRGHWRGLTDGEALGLNSDGERIVPGKTWVKSHYRGEDSKPVLNKKWKVKL